ncbi:MAG: chlorophyll a/b-binding protein [Cyanobacteria bacterium]|nr:chlorophyll a/b-binding protein [Cyanobacteriota bacterium]MDA1247130.1 chlorophyll a/b-binding protein [Cyanobacteriota bacterium]
MTTLDRERDLQDTALIDQVPDGFEPVGAAELNSWRRGFTPQAEIWNGRLAMVGLSVGLSVLLVARLASH